MAFWLPRRAPNRPKGGLGREKEMKRARNRADYLKIQQATRRVGRVAGKTRFLEVPLMVVRDTGRVNISLYAT